MSTSSSLASLTISSMSPRSNVVGFDLRGNRGGLIGLSFSVYGGYDDLINALAPFEMLSPLDSRDINSINL